MAAPSWRTATTAHGPIEYADVGDPSGPVVLTVHGSPGGVDQGIAMGHFLAAEGFRVVAMSRPGYLGTPLTPANAGIDAQADVGIALLDELGVASAGVLAWSGGGPMGYRLARRHPHRVRALVALAALSRTFEWHLSGSDRLLFGTRPGALVVALVSRFAPQQVVSGALASEGDLNAGEIKRRTAEIMADPQRRQFILTVTATTSLRADRRAGVRNDQRSFAAMADLDLAGITVPTLVVAGDADADVTPDFSTFAHRQIPGSELLMMPGGTHLCLYVDPGYLAAQQRVATFLR